MANTYTKEDVDRAYAAGVANAEKLWQSYLLNMLDEGSIKVHCFECQKCGERYRIDPAVAYPKIVLCPSCARHRSDVIGICNKVERRVSVTQYQLTAMQSAVSNLVDPLVTLREVFETSPAAQGLTMEQAQQLPQYQKLMRALTYTQELNASGWDMHKLAEIMPADSGVGGKTPLDRYDSAKPVDCV